jgi:tagatose 1,6-diphosphate aldolase
MQFILKPNDIIKGEKVHLRVNKLCEGIDEIEWKPAYRFDICDLDMNVVGVLDLRLGYSDYLVKFAGHLGYEIKPKYRGNSYSYYACKLLNTLLLKHQMDTIWITCNPENAASIRICEKLEAALVETIDIPVDTDMYDKGERQKLRYRLCLV